MLKVVARANIYPPGTEHDMAKLRHLEHAPVTEALIDIHVKPQSEITFDTLRAAVAGLDFGYFEKGTISRSRIEFNLMPDADVPESHSTPIGLRFHSADDKYVAQFRVSGFTLSRMRPYENWESLAEESKRLWKVYCASVAPSRVTRLATRFINDLQLPLTPGASYQDYLIKLVDVPDEVPQAVGNFFQRFELYDRERDARVNLIVALEGPSSGEHVPVILDINAFKRLDCDTATSQIWGILDRLRDLKNETFFGCLTENAVELYQ
jgi:uncharacterized protein (TIGR04255 family)